MTDEIRAWLDPSGGICLKAVTTSGDPVEISAQDARTLAALLVELAQQDES